MKSTILFRVFALAIICLLSLHARSQRLGFIFAHGQYAKTSGSLNDSHNYGLGGEIGAGIGSGGNFLTLMTGYTSFHGRGNFANLKMVPIKLGLRRYVLQRLIYLKADAGLANLSAGNGSGSSQRFTASGGVGTKLAGLELEADYSGFTGSGGGTWVGLKAGFYFGL